MRVSRFAIAVALTALAHGQATSAQTAQSRQHGRLFPPQDLGLLEAPDRDSWQHPDQVMDRLGIAEASIVADIGAGSGWFTIRLARRVGPNGIVYAEDVQQQMITAISRRAAAENLRNVRPILGLEGDPKLPRGAVDAVLLVNSYQEIADRVPFLMRLATALKPGGRIGIIDFKREGSGPGPAIEERVSPDTVLADATKAGLRLLSRETFLPYQYFFVFAATGDVTAKPALPGPAATGSSTPRGGRRWPR